MRAAGRVASHAVSATPQQAYGAASIAAQRVGQADGDLCQALPQVALARRCGLPGRLKHLVRVERPIAVNQFLGGRQRFQRRPGPVVSRWLADRIPGQRAAECVARPGIACSPGCIAISASRHLLALWLGISQPGTQLKVEAVACFLVREVPGPVK
jgi:hypothetical protein